MCQSPLTGGRTGAADGQPRRQVTTVFEQWANRRRRALEARHRLEIVGEHVGTGREDPHFIDAKPSCMILARDADLYVDELYQDAPLEGATLLVSHVSRYVVDLNRAETDVDAESVSGVATAARSMRAPP